MGATAEGETLTETRLCIRLVFIGSVTKVALILKRKVRELNKSLAERLH